MRVEILPSTAMAASPEQMPTRRYRIERYLTEGGMGAIYVGKKLGPGGFEKEVVLKQLLPEYTARPEFRDLFFTALAPVKIFRSLVTIFAGYWHPSFRTRAWVRAFFLLVRLQRYVRVAPPVISNPDRARTRKAVA